MSSVIDPSLLSQLAPDIDDTEWPRLRLKHLSLHNFGKHENTEIDFTHHDRVMPLVSLVGPNGAGKSTILNAIQLLFNNFTGYAPERYQAMMMKYVRNYLWMNPAEMLGANFSVKGIFTDGQTDYPVEVTRQAILSRHPEFIDQHLSYYCFFARFDQELGLFQLKRKRWPQFQELFSGVTGFTVEEDASVFDATDEESSALLRQYVGGFKVIKPEETIVHKQCSAGERKIAKCFSTILNKPVQPSIILIDNVTDHVETDRHLPVIANIEKCFPNSQLIVTCHSVPVQRNLPNRERLIDMRLLTANEVILREPWRLRLIDEVKDALQKVSNLRTKLDYEVTGNKLLSDLETYTVIDPATKVSDYVRKVSFQYLVETMVIEDHPKIVNKKLV